MLRVGMQPRTRRVAVGVHYFSRRTRSVHRSVTTRSLTAIKLREHQKFYSVIPAKAGIQSKEKPLHSKDTPQRHIELNHWIPAFAGMTESLT